MKFGHPLVSTELSGSLGGVVGSKSRGGVGYFRMRSRPGNPRTLAQSFVRAALSSIASAWRSTLSTVQRDAWTAYAKPSESGINVFSRSNTLLEQAGQPIALTAPTGSINLPNAPLTGVVVDASAHTVTLSAPVPGDQMALVYVAKQQSPSRDAQQFPFQFAAAADETDTFITLAPGQAGYNLTAGEIAYVKVVFVGKASLAATVGATTIPQIFREIIVA
jgi:hypothetical protein